LLHFSERAKEPTQRVFSRVKGQVSNKKVLHSFTSRVDCPARRGVDVVGVNQPPQRSAHAINLWRGEEKPRSLK
jgi:hypothetical protein